MDAGTAARGIGALPWDRRIRVGFHRLRVCGCGRGGPWNRGRLRCDYRPGSGRRFWRRSGGGGALHQRGEQALWRQVGPDEPLPGRGHLRLRPRRRPRHLHNPGRVPTPRSSPSPRAGPTASSATTATARLPTWPTMVNDHPRRRKAPRHRTTRAWFPRIGCCCKWWEPARLAGGPRILPHPHRRYRRRQGNGPPNYVVKINCKDGTATVLKTTEPPPLPTAPGSETRREIQDR